MKASFSKRCGCKDPETKKPLDSGCPELTKQRHGTHGFTTRLDTTDRRARQLKRFGFTTKGAAEKAFDHVQDLVKLARDDDVMRRKIGDLIFATKRGQELPDVEEVRRKLKLGVDLAASAGTVGELLEDWYASKRGTKESTRRGWRQHLDHYLVPQLGEIPRDRLRAAHVDGMFDTIEEWNAEIRAAAAEKRSPHLPGDVRERHKVIGIATQHRVFATLRNAFNWAVKRRMVEFNPCLGVELPAEERDPARVWSPEQVGMFMEAAEHDPLGLLYRIVLLRGLRRGEACGLRWSDVDMDTGHARIMQTVLQLGGRIVIDTPKSKAGNRVVSLDTGTVKLLKAHHTAQRREKFAAGGGYEDNDLVFPRPDGRPLPPDRVTERFKQIAKDAGLPVIKLHEARHTAASLGLEAGLDVKVVSVQLGHSTTTITRDLYQHVRRAVLDDAAEKVVALIPDRKGSRKARP
ncbi:site-specific integrase [Planobispora rosea]|uniref:Site-specific integrase n=1 Tax=Planobispora rosea TaxID=35762 RepID=A0A8J3SB94_PLARO|nr:site-specific integrase [Planobispora rosea]GGS87514.1 site-specific integrase [Planobispora rosea]GIH86653.1 site-specific integrase [Planobispora rosea]